MKPTSPAPVLPPAALVGEAAVRLQPVKEWPVESRPRERLIADGALALSAHELIALVVGTGIPGAPAIDLARRLLAAGEGLRGLSCAGVDELLRVRGVGDALAARIVATFELGRRVASDARPRGERIQSGADVHRLLAARLRDLKKEVFLALLIDGKSRLLRVERISEGTLTSSLVHPREVFAPAIRSAAFALVVAHNHPSGDPTPSREDLEVTARLAEVGRVVGIELLDHVILGESGPGGFVSLRERGHLVGGGQD